MKLRVPSWSVVVTHSAESGGRDDPRARQRGDAQAVAGVVLQVVEIHERGLGEVVIRVDLGARPIQPAGFVLSHGDIVLWLMIAFSDAEPPPHDQNPDGHVDMGRRAARWIRSRLRRA